MTLHDFLQKYRVSNRDVRIATKKFGTETHSEKGWKELLDKHFVLRAPEPTAKEKAAAKIAEVKEKQSSAKKKPENKSKAADKSKAEESNK